MKSLPGDRGSEQREGFLGCKSPAITPFLPSASREGPQPTWNLEMTSKVSWSEPSCDITTGIAVACPAGLVG